MSKRIIIFAIASSLTIVSFGQKKTSVTTGSAQTKNNVTKTSAQTPLTQTTSTSDVKNLYDEAPKKVVVEDKYQVVIANNISKLKEVDQLISEKKKAYSKAVKSKGDASYISEIDRARVEMIAEIIGPEAANYYIKNNILQ